MNSTSKYHAIKVDSAKCFGCTHCMKVCPTEAIRIRNGLAVINDQRCVDCGNCMRVCPADAFYILQDDLSRIYDFKYRVVLFPSVMIGQFPDHISEGQIYQALLQLGFTHVFEVEQPIQWLIEAIREYHRDHTDHRPLISSFCPAIVRLIQIKYPSLIDHVVLVKAPHDLAAHFAIEKLKQQGAREEEIGIFYVAPCSAKIVAVRRPLGEKESIVNGVINMNELYNRVMKVVSKEEPADNPACREHLTREGILWCLPRGEARLFKKRSMAIDGIHNVVKMLEKLEIDDVPEIDFLELRSCDQSCAGGILLSGNRFLTVERLQRRSRHYPLAAENSPEQEIKEKVVGRLAADPIAPAQVFRLDADLARAIEKMDKVNRIICQLPAIDCGACGAPNCHALAEDMVMGMAKMSDCIYLQQRWQKEGKITSNRAFSNLEKTWGEGRFEADCNKKGARNEGF